MPNLFDLFDMSPQTKNSEGRRGEVTTPARMTRHEHGFGEVGSRVGGGGHTSGWAPGEVITDVGKGGHSHHPVAGEVTVPLSGGGHGLPSHKEQNDVTSDDDLV